MSKNKSIEERESELRGLQAEIAAKDFLTNKEKFIFAFHFARLDHVLKSRVYLNKIDKQYFESFIFADLFQSTLGELMARTDPNNLKYSRQYEFFLLVRKAIPLFSLIDFSSKKEFEVFCKTLAQLETFS